MFTKKFQNIKINKNIKYSKINNNKIINKIIKY